jgi:hypothetical protein
MDINKAELEAKRKGLETKYNDLEERIESFYDNDSSEKASKLELEQNKINKEINIIDEIISNMDLSQKLYKEYKDLENE